MSQQKILAIDDLAESLNLYESLIQKYLPDAQYLRAMDGKTGLQLAAESSPDLILVDAKMPEMDGFEIVNRLRADPATAPIPILMVSGVMTAHENRISGFASGADGYICKPFQSEEFIAEINVLLRIKDYEDQLRQHEQALEDELQTRTGDLVESELLFRTLFEESPDAIFVESEDGLIIDVNEAGCNLHEMSREELIGKSPHELILEKPKKSGREAPSDLFRDVYQRGELFAVAKSGQKIPVEIRSKKIAQTKNPLSIIIVRDIRQRKRIELALQTIATEVSPLTGYSFFYGLVEQISKVLEADYVALTKLDPEEPGMAETFALWGEGRIMDNIKYPMAGTPCERVYKTNFCAYGDGVQESFPEDQMLGAMEIRSYIGSPLYNTDSSALGHIFAMSKKPMADFDLPISMLKIFGARAAAEFERIQATERLWKSEERHRSLTDDVLDRSLVGLFILDQSHKIVWANEILSTYLQIDRDSVIGVTMEELVEGPISRQFANPAEFKQVMLGELAHSDTNSRVEFHIPPQPGVQERWLEHFSQPIRTGLYAGGRIEHFADITRQKNFQDQLLQVHKMEGIGRLAGGVAHDFNNLLTSILGFSNLVLDELEPNSPLRASVYEIIHAGKLAEKLTRQLLVFGRKQVMQVRPIHLNTVVKEMEQLLQRTLGEDIELVSEMAPDLPTINADPGQIEQIIMNLAVNARDAMTCGGRLVIRTKQASLDDKDVKGWVNTRPGNCVCLTMSDSGTGISDDIVRHIFEPFFTTKDHDKGTGLGLSIVYGIVEQFNGMIDVVSKEGQGTDFHIFFPAAAAKTAEKDSRSKENLPTGTGTILVVEDEPTVRHLTLRILVSLGYNVFTARDAEEALEIFDAKSDEIDLVLSDVVMPKMSGKELANELEKRGKPFRIIYTSGFTEDRIEDHGISADAHRLILKPYSREILATAVSEALQEPLGS